MKKINVLLVSAGKRIELIKKFQQNYCYVCCYENSLKCPAYDYADVICGRNFDDEGIKKDIKEAILDCDFDLVIPCYDNAIPILAELKEEDSEISDRIIVSSKKSSEICFDKAKFERWMDIFPEYYPYCDFGYDLIGKPVKGCGSKGLYLIAEEDARNHRCRDGYIYQRFVTGKEISCDVYGDRYGKFIGGVPRIREKVCCGEVVESTIILNEELVEITKKIAEELRVIGPANFQWILDEEGCYWLIECNLRFCGGYTLSMEAGLNAVGWIIDEYIYNRKIEPISLSKIKPLKLVRSFRDHYFNEEAL